MSHEIQEERTRAEQVSPTWDRKNEDVSFLVLRGPDMGRRFLVKPPGGVVGREEGAAIQTRDTTISRRAALIEFTAEGRVMITDLGSKNGVYIDGVRISRAEIYDGNHVQLSNDTVMRVRFQDPVETELLEEMQGAVMVDTLTGLPNRRYLKGRLAQEMAWARRRQDPLSLALFDVDDIKKVIDADGQQAADELVATIAGLLRGRTRQEDVVIRYGADEVIVLMRGTGSDEATQTVARLTKAIGSRVYDVGDVPIKATVSVGLVIYPEPREAPPPPKPSKKAAAKKAPAKTAAKPAPPERQESLELVGDEEVSEVLARADAALYKAKQDGKDRFVWWEDTKG
ncbi:MAG: GGDEF domain-containing protein [Polyangiaceae bacterium]